MDTQQKHYQAPGSGPICRIDRANANGQQMVLWAENGRVQAVDESTGRRTSYPIGQARYIRANLEEYLRLFTRQDRSRLITLIPDFDGLTRTLHAFDAVITEARAQLARKYAEYQPFRTPALSGAPSFGWDGLPL